MMTPWLRMLGRDRALLNERYSRRHRTIDPAERKRLEKKIWDAMPSSAQMRYNGTLVIRLSKKMSKAMGFRYTGKGTDLGRMPDQALVRLGQALKVIPPPKPLESVLDGDADELEERAWTESLRKALRDDPSLADEWRRHVEDMGGAF